MSSSQEEPATFNGNKEGFYNMIAAVFPPGTYTPRERSDGTVIVRHNHTHQQIGYFNPARFTGWVQLATAATPTGPAAAAR